MSEGGTMEHEGLVRKVARLTVVRLVLFTVVLLAFYTVLQTLRDVSVNATPKPLQSALLIFANLLICTFMIVAYWGVVRLIEGRDAKELSFGASTAWALPGILVGTLLFCSVIAVLWMKGVATFAGFNSFDGVLPIVADALATAVGEEIIFRGAVFRVVEQGIGTLVALTVSASLFGVVHAGNIGATPVSTISIAVEAGVLLGIAYTATRSLWFPIGIHFGWNFAEGGVFSAAVSGNPEQGLLKVTLSGPAVWTGGAFGPEASIVAVAVCLAASVLLGWAAFRSGCWRRFGVRHRTVHA